MGLLNNTTRSKISWLHCQAFSLHSSSSTVFLLVLNAQVLSLHVTMNVKEHGAGFKYYVTYR